MSDAVANLKEQANAEYRRGQYKLAINLYTRALEAALHTTPAETEIKRQILANRAQAYRLWGEIYAALQDADSALSPEYTTPDSPKAMTAKCFYRRSKLRYQHAMYDEALADYERFEELQAELGEPVEKVAQELRAEIQKAVDEPEDGEARELAELIRACNYRGIQISEDGRASFPTPPKHPDLSTHFDSLSGGPNSRLANPSATPLVIPFKIVFVGLKDPTGPAPSFTATMEIAEQGDPSEPGTDTIGIHLQNLLPSFAMFHGRNSFSHSDMAEYSRRNAELVMLTHKGRFLIIPWDTKIRDIWKGARWPRSSPSPFRDARTAPWARSCESDGAALERGFITMQVVPKNDLDAFVQLVLTHTEAKFFAK